MKGRPKVLPSPDGICGKWKRPKSSDVVIFPMND
jgi:hypothetical protein